MVASDESYPVWISNLQHQSNSHQNVILRQANDIALKTEREKMPHLQGKQQQKRFYGVKTPINKVA